MPNDEFSLALDEGMNEAFAWFLGQWRKDDDYDEEYLPRIRWFFHVAYMRGVIWGRQSTRVQGKSER